MAAAAVGIMTIPMHSQAMEHRSYTYIYDYWGDVQDTPDLYEVFNVFTSAELGLDTRMNNPNGITVAGDKVYICGYNPWKVSSSASRVHPIITNSADLPILQYPRMETSSSRIKEITVLSRLMPIFIILWSSLFPLTVHFPQILFSFPIR